jgi:hypothetical protein
MVHRVPNANPQTQLILSTTALQAQNPSNLTGRIPMSLMTNSNTVPIFVTQLDIRFDIVFNIPIMQPEPLNVSNSILIEEQADVYFKVHKLPAISIFRDFRTHQPGLWDWYSVKFTTPIIIDPGKSMYWQVDKFDTKNTDMFDITINKLEFRFNCDSLPH